MDDFLTDQRRCRMSEETGSRIDGRAKGQGSIRRALQQTNLTRRLRMRDRIERVNCLPLSAVLFITARIQRLNFSSRNSYGYNGCY